MGTIPSWWAAAGRTPFLMRPREATGVSGMTGEGGILFRKRSCTHSPEADDLHPELWVAALFTPQMNPDPM